MLSFRTPPGAMEKRDDGPEKEVDKDVSAQELDRLESAGDVGYTRESHVTSSVKFRCSWFVTIFTYGRGRS